MFLIVLTLELLHPPLLGVVDGPIEQAEENNAANNPIAQLLYGCIWLASAYSAGGLEYAAGGHMNNDGVAAVTGAVCGTITGVVLQFFC